MIAVELVFSSNATGLGWCIFNMHIALGTATVVAGLLTVILIGLAVEGIVFRSIEPATIRKWGTQNQRRLHERRVFAQGVEAARYILSSLSQPTKAAS